MVVRSCPSCWWRSLTTLAVQYHVSNQAIGAEFFRAHKTISQRASSCGAAR